MTDPTKEELSEWGDEYIAELASLPQEVQPSELPPRPGEDADIEAYRVWIKQLERLEDHALARMDDEPPEEHTMAAFVSGAREQMWWWVVLGLIFIAAIALAVL